MAERRAEPEGAGVDHRRLAVLLFVANAALFSSFQGVQGVLVPAAVESLAPAGKVPALGLLTTLSAVTTIVAMMTGGALSDRTWGRWGRRTPWLVGCVLSAALLMAAMAGARTLLRLDIVMPALWFVLNLQQTILLAVIPDRVPEAHRGFASAAVGLGVTAGIFIGYNAVALLPGPAASYAALAVFLVAGTLVLVTGAREPAASRPAPATRGAGGAGAYFQAFRSSDYTLTFASRFVMFLAYFMMISYFYYTLQDHIGVDKLPGRSVPKALSTIMTVQTVFWLLITPVTGVLADRVGRTSHVVGAAGLVIGLVFLIPLLLPTWPGLLLFGAGLGLTFGVVFALDLKLVSLVLPDPAMAGRDMGLMAVAASGPTVLAPAAAGFVIQRGGGYPVLFGACAVLAVAGALIVFRVRTGRADHPVL